MAADYTKLPRLRALRSMALKIKAEHVAILETCSEAILELAGVKADKPEVVTVTIGTTTGTTGNTGVWIKDDLYEDFPYYYDIPATGVTADDIVDMNIAFSSYQTVSQCGLSKVNESLADKIRIRSYTVPTSSITAYYRVTNTNEQ